MRHAAHTASAALALTLLSSVALAQVPTSVDPSKVEERFDDRVAVPPSSTTTLPELPAARQAAGQESGKRFVVNSIAIEGSTVYSQAQLTPVFQDVLGKEISLGEARGLADKITLKYRTDGYILSQATVPNQTITGGVLRIRVIEGFISKVIVEGSVKDSRATTLIAGYGDKITREKPLNIKTLERYLLLMDDLPGATAKGVVRPSPDTFGAADLVINVTHKTLDGLLSVDNRGSKYIGPNQATAMLTANSLFNLYDRTTARGVITPDGDELQFFDLQHEEQLGREGTRLVATGTHSRTRPGFLLETADVEGTSNSLDVKVLHPFIRSRAENLVGRASLDYRDTDTDFGGAPLSNDRITSARIGAAFDTLDFLNGVNLVDAQFSQGLNLFNPSEKGLGGSVPQSRTDGETEYSKLNLDISRTQLLPFAGLALYTGFSGQYSFDRLLASEQFSIGGPAFGSAYDPAELSGDQGIAGRAELRYSRAGNFRYLNAYQVYSFYDIGKVWTKGAGHASLASAGLGLRSNFTDWLSGSGELAFPLTKDIATKNDDDARLFFNLTGRF